MFEIFFILCIIFVDVFFIDFEYLQVNDAISAPFDAVEKSLRKNGVAIKGVINVPETSRSGELKSVNQYFRSHLDLYANVVKVCIFQNTAKRHTL